MYLIINEDGGASKTEKLTEDQLEAEDMGFIDIFDISDPDSPLRRLRSIWMPVEDNEDAFFANQT